MSLLRKILVALVVIVLAMIALALIGLARSGAWNLVFENRTHETVAPEVPADLASPAVLLFTKTNGFRHAAGIEAGKALLESIAARRGWSIFHTENGAVFGPALLARFDAVVFHNASGDTLDEAQEAAFVEWLEAGGGWLGTHSAGDSSHADWTWYVETLIGANFTAHIMGPQFQSARVVTEDRSHPATRALPAEWSHTEEWYSWDTSPRGQGFRVLASIDESSYSPRAVFMGSDTDLAMGDHPVIWTTCVGRGRAFYSALGHGAEAYETPEHKALLEGALAWVVGAEGPGC